MRADSKNAIALLITLFFLMAITMSIGVGLKYLNKAKSNISQENFLLQTNVILDDVLTFLEKSPELQLIKKDKSGEAYDMFLAQSEFIPFETAGVKFAISIKSARRKINLNDLLKLEVEDGSEEPKLLQQFRNFLSQYNVNPIYVSMLKDSISNYDINYYPATDILDAKPYIFREYIASYEHLEEINEHYKNRYYENSLSKIDFEDLFYIAPSVGDSNSTGDLNSTSSYCIDSYYISPWAAHMLEGVELSSEDNLDNNPKNDFIVDVDNSRFSSLYCKDQKQRQVVLVELEVMQNNNTANISFEYDILNSKGYNFSYEI